MGGCYGGGRLCVTGDVTRACSFDRLWRTSLCPLVCFRNTNPDILSLAHKQINTQSTLGKFLVLF